MKYILFGLLGMSVGGLVVMDVRGVLSGGGVGSSDVARVGNHDISLRDFDRVLRASISQYNITPEQAYKTGIIREVLNAQVKRGFLINEARNIGLSVPKDYLAEYIGRVVKPQARPGQSLQQTLDELLRFRQISEQDFVANVKDEILSEMIIDAVRQGARPDIRYLAEDLKIFQDQSRDLDLIIFPNSEITDISEPTEDQISRLYESVKRTRYKLPEYRSAEVVTLNLDAVPLDITVSDEDVREIYDDNADAFMVDEQYVITQTVVDQQDKAQEIYALIQQGKTLKEATQEIFPKGGANFFENTPFEKSSMIPELLAEIEKIPVGGIIAPVQTALGHHIVLLNETIPAKVRDFDSVKDNIRENLIREKRSDALYKVAQRFEEIISEGTSLDQIEQEMDVTRKKIPLITAQGMSPPKNEQAEASEEIAASPMAQFNQQDSEMILEILFELTQNDPVMVEELPSGAFSAIILMGVVQESFEPVNSVKTELKQQFIADQQRDANREKVGKFLAEIQAGGSTLESISKETGKDIFPVKNVNIGGVLPAPIIDQNRPVIFKTAMNGHDYLELENGYAIMKISGFSLGKDNPEEGSDLQIIRKQLDEEAVDEAFLAYLKGLSITYKATVNERLLNTAYGGTQE